MTYAETSDTQLVALADQGVAPAFAVLVHRHGPTILTLAADDEDPVGATVATFVRAMRTLADAPDDVATWLRQLAFVELDIDPDPAFGSDLGSSLPPDVTASDAQATAEATGSITAVLDPRLDEVWAELDLRWPDGKLRRHVPSWILWLGTTLVLLALAVLLPWAVLGSIDPHESVDELRASPLEDADESAEDEPEAEPIPDETDDEPLPSFDFPEPPDGQAGGASTAAPANDTEPAPATSPQPVDETSPDVGTAPADEDSEAETGGSTPAGDGTGGDPAGDEPTSGEAQEPDAGSGDTGDPLPQDGTSDGDTSGDGSDDADDDGSADTGATDAPGTVDEGTTNDAGPAGTVASTSAGRIRPLQV